MHRINFGAIWRALTAAAFLIPVGAPAQAGGMNLGALTGPYTIGFSSSYGTGYVFNDDYSFSLAASSEFDALAATLDLGSFAGISGLDAKLFQVAANQPDVLVASGFDFSMSAGQAGVSGSVVKPLTLGAGAYELELTGTTTGSVGGAYGGVLNLSPPFGVTSLPVPEPQTGAMLLFGLGMLGLTLTRRKPVDRKN